MARSAPGEPAAGPSDLADAAREAWVIWVGLFALGIGLGVLVTSHGFPWWLAPLISAVVYAGSVEFIIVGMLAIGAPIAAIALTTFLVNSRHLFYGLSFPLHRVDGPLRKTYSMFALTDEAYALTASKDPETIESGHIVWTQVGLHVSWVAGAFTGGLIGATALRNVRGLGFILTALFVVLALDAYRSRPDKVTLAAAVGSSAIAFLLARSSMVLVAMAIFTVVLIVRHQLDHRGAGHG